MARRRALELDEADPATRTTGDLARAVRHRREQLGLRQSELADLAGTSSRTVHAVETAKPSVQLDSVLAVLGALGLELRVAVSGGGRQGTVVDATPHGPPA